MDLTTLADRMKPLVFKASGMIAEAWNSHQIIAKRKDERDMVTTTDVAVEDYLRGELSKLLPEAGFIVEEGLTEQHGEYNFAIDPIDGTKYFAGSVPMFFSQVSLLKGTEPVISFVSQPITGQVFSAVKGNGSYLNSVRIAPPSISSLSESIAEFDSGSMSGSANAWKFRFFEKICPHLYRPRFTGGHLSVYLTTHAVDLGMNLDVKVPPSVKNIVDLAPHRLIILEAGYSEATVSFEDHGVLIWASQTLITQIRELLEYHA